MRILIDECLNWRLARALTGHYAVSAQKMGWGGIQNGALLDRLPLMTKVLAALPTIQAGQVVDVYP